MHYWTNKKITPPNENILAVICGFLLVANYILRFEYQIGICKIKVDWKALTNKEYHEGIEGIEQKLQWIGNKRKQSKYKQWR